jgi:hypothetical protein
MSKTIIVGAAFVCALAAGPAFAHHPAGAALGSVTITHSVLAGDKTLEPGTYEIRDTGEHLMPLPGQSEEAATWVEILSNGTVVARVGAELIPSAPVAVGTSGGGGRRAVVHMLKGGEFLRISAHHDGERVLIHLPMAK